MTTTNDITLFQKMNFPFPYSEYQYDSFNDRCYVSGQAITERLNEVLGVGYWKYQGLHETEKIIQDNNGKGSRVKIYVEFSFYNTDLKEWVTFVDAGSEQIKAGMNEGDATKSAITDGMKKCASRLGVASDLYKGLVTWDKQRQCIIVPEHYLNYYEQQNLTSPINHNQTPTTQQNKKTTLTAKLQQRPSTTQAKMKTIWKSLAGDLDGFTEWVSKKKQEKLTEKQMLLLLEQRANKQKAVTTA